MLRILVIEDDRRLAEVIRRGLEEEGFGVSLAFDGPEGKKKALNEDVQLIVSDIILPGMDGIALCRSVRASRPSVPIIMLTALGTTDDKVEGFDAGADDYLVKPFEFRELYARIRALLKRAENSPGTAGRVLSYGGVRLDIHTKSVSRDQTEISLTPKEFNLLTYMLQNPERVLSRQEISEQVWNTHFDTGTNFIDVYINYLRKKVDKPFQNKLIHTKPGMGFILKQE